MNMINAENESEKKSLKSGILNDQKNAARILQLTADTMFLLNEFGICMDLEIHTDRWFLQDATFFVGKNVFELIPYETSMALHRNFDKVLQTGQKSVDNYEVQVAGKNYYFKCFMYLYDKDLVLCQYRDITQRVLLKQSIEVINHRLKEVEKVAKIGQWSINLKTRIIQYSGLSLGQEPNKETNTITFEKLLERIHPIDKEQLKASLDKNLSDFGNGHVDFQIVENDTCYFYRVRVINTYNSESGDPILEGYIQNVTDIMLKQRELEMITLAVKNSTDYIFSMNLDGKLVFGNHRFKEYHKLDNTKKISNLNFFKDIMPTNYMMRWHDIIQELSTTSKTLNFVLPKPIPERPEMLALDCTSYLIRDTHGSDQIWTFGKDITERVQYEKQVKELNQIMSTVLANIPMNISVKDVENDLRYIFSNRMGNKIHWGMKDDIIGKTDFDLFPKDEAVKLRSDDMDAVHSREEIRRLILNKDKNGKSIVFDQLRLLVEDENRPLLISIERDITKDKLMEQELINAKVKAEESDKLKSAFIANMSHEIRTPLNAIVGFSKIIADTTDPEERKSYYSIVETNNGRLLGLINEILDLSKIESGIMEFNIETFHLSALCKDIQQTLQMRCQPGVQLKFEVSDKNLLLSSDKNRVSQVLNNLIGNAIKFTKEGHIRFGYKLEEDALVFHVSDSGKGIPEDKIDKVFDRFIKGDNFTQGTGLGLPICRSIIEKLGGSINLESEVNVGTTFTFTLPGKCVVSSQNSHTNKATEKISILIAEDTDMNYLLLENMLGKDYELIRALNGMEAVTLFQEVHPDLIFMDIKMPVMNGIDATKIIRSISSDIPIIAQTAFSMDFDRNIAMEAGCNAFLTKPYDKKQILETIKNFTASK
jgi:signal transduction histidine kinase/CheY-like chemotaxis protein